MKTLVVFLEEESAREMLTSLLPGLLPDDIQIRFIVLEGKQDLEKQIVLKLRWWRAPDSCFLILRDQDAADCRRVKDNLGRLCREAGKPETLVRIACRELESWYFGDLTAVEQGLEFRDISRSQNKKAYRNPDNIVYLARELTRLTQGRYQKISGSRAIGPYLDPKANTSRSFQVFITGVKRLCQAR